MEVQCFNTAPLCHPRIIANKCSPSDCTTCYIYIYIIYYENRTWSTKESKKERKTKCKKVQSASTKYVLKLSISTLTSLLDGQGRARPEAARRRKSECKVNLDILNLRANDSKNCILEHVAYGLASAYSVRALAVCQYARNNFFCLWTKVHHVIHVSTVKVWWEYSH